MRNVWIRLPTNQGLKLIYLSSFFLYNWIVWIRLPTNQGLKLSGTIIISQMLFWCLNPTSNKSRIETYLPCMNANRAGCLNPTSNKSRIETFMDHKLVHDSKGVWIRLPTNQGLKLLGLIVGGIFGLSLNPTSNKSRIETLLFSRCLIFQPYVWIRLPTNQGLKPSLNTS